jgi:hypothetical protein
MEENKNYALKILLASWTICLEEMEGGGGREKYKNLRIADAPAKILTGKIS